MKDTINFSLVIEFSDNPNFGGTGGVAGTTVSLKPDNGGKSAIVTINDDGHHPRPIRETIKHEVSHTYGVPNDEVLTQNSVMSSAPTALTSNLSPPMPKTYNLEWPVDEMYMIHKNRNWYPNREIKKVTSFNSKLKINRIGTLFFTEVMSSPQAGLGYINGYAQVDIDIDKKPFGDFHMLETVNSIYERLNSIGMTGNEIRLNKLFNPNAGSVNPTDTYKLN
ncbi:TPA: hypothetical protein ROY17_005348 [Bacillus thuringiensis]|nr:hypothetical protein [Bacillus thuringiensis]